ncbi:MAG: WYL domain-containing protein [Clostridia bacterium]|nr:WYL domain-containing protein [Clostridia bacterium]
MSSVVANRKLRILRLLDLLRSETDDEHCLTTVEICERLTAEGYECDRKTLYDDVELLNAYGVAIEKQRWGKGNGYYIADQQFDVSELKIIVDALHAANFINEKKTDALIEKVAKLGGKHKEGAIKAIDVHFNNRKHSSTHTYYNVETIAKAISEKKKISFYAYNLNYRATPVYRHHKKRYTEEPISLVFHSDNYYVIIYREDRGVFTRRIDRLSDISVCDETISAEAEAKIAETEKFSTDVFGMYTGPREKVILEFTDETFEYIFDKFGEKQKIIKTEVVDGVQIYSTEVDVEISPPFWGWVCTFAGKLRIAGPNWVNTEFNKWKRNENKLDLQRKE